MKKSVIILWILILLALAVIEFPGIFFINRIEPVLFGLPFIYSFTLIIWFLLCILMYIGYKLSWGLEKENKGYKKE